jgi:TolB protein
MPASRGKALTQITNTTNCRDNHPCFSPDGNLILFDRIKSTLSDGQYHYYNSNSEIWVKNLQTGENTLLGQGLNPVFSPDGKKIVYAKYQASQSQIWIMDSNGENQSKLTDNNTLQWAYRPRFSPDGKYIIFTGNKKIESDNSSDLYIVPSDGGDLTRLTISKASDYHPYWANDGYIYFVSDRGAKKGDFNIWRFKFSAE